MTFDEDRYPTEEEWDQLRREGFVCDGCNVRVWPAPNETDAQDAARWRWLREIVRQAGRRPSHSGVWLSWLPAGVVDEAPWATVCVRDVHARPHARQPAPCLALWESAGLDAAIDDALAAGADLEAILACIRETRREAAPHGAPR